MKILVVNAGSSSLKFQLFDARTETVLIKGTYDGIGLTGAESSCERKIVMADKTDRDTCTVGDHESAIGDMLETLRIKGAISDRAEIAAVLGLDIPLQKLLVGFPLHIKEARLVHHLLDP